MKNNITELIVTFTVGLALIWLFGNFFKAPDQEHNHFTKEHRLNVKLHHKLTLCTFYGDTMQVAFKGTKFQQHITY